ncbi:hypothetical protein Tco_1022076 [Tanacetum coccineum]
MAKYFNDEYDNNNDQDSSNEDSEQENESEEQVSDLEQEEESEDDDQEDEKFVHTPSPTNDKDDDYLESESDYVNKSNEESDDVNKSDEESDDVIKGDKEIVQGEGVDAEMTDTQQGNENLETTQEQVVEDAYVTISTVTKKTEVPVTSSSRSSDLASKFLIFLDIPHTDAKIVSPLDVHDPLHTQVTTLVDEHLDTWLGETREEFMNFLLESLTARIKEQVKDQLPQILSKEVSNFALLMIEALIKESRDEVTLAKAPEHRYCYDSLKKSYDLDKYFFFSYGVYSLKRSHKDKDKDEDPSARSDRGSKKRKLRKDAEPTTGPKKKDSTYGSSKGIKSQPKSSKKFVQSEEPMFEVADSDIPQDQEGNLGTDIQ